MDLSLFGFRGAVSQIGRLKETVKIMIQSPFDVTSFDDAMARDGLYHFHHLLGSQQLEALREDCDQVYEQRRAIQVRNGVDKGMEGAAHHVLGDDTSLDQFLANLPLADLIERHFGGKYILLNFGATLHPPGGSAYTLKPHRDVRAWTKDYPLSLNMLVMLDDFTAQNGATLVLAGSHLTEAMPSYSEFTMQAKQVEGKAGDILLFNSLVVHSAAPNQSDRPRKALTLCFGRPFMKPQMDWPRFLRPDAEAHLTPLARQLLGYDARVAASLDEYYQPPEHWTFKPDQR